MSKKSGSTRTKEIMSMLLEQFSQAFSLNPNEVRPLESAAFNDVQIHLQLFGDDEKYLRRVFSYYRNSTTYIRAVALGKRERDILGRKSKHIMPQKRREKARKILQQRGHWSDNLEGRYQGHLKDLLKQVK